MTNSLLDAATNDERRFTKHRPQQGKPYICRRLAESHVRIIAWDVVDDCQTHGQWDSRSSLVTCFHEPLANVSENRITAPAAGYHQSPFPRYRQLPAVSQREARAGLIQWQIDQSHKCPARPVNRAAIGQRLIVPLEIENAPVGKGIKIGELLAQPYVGIA